MEVQKDDYRRSSMVFGQDVGQWFIVGAESDRTELDLKERCTH